MIAITGLAPPTTNQQTKTLTCGIPPQIRVKIREIVALLFLFAARHRDHQDQHHHTDANKD